MLLRYLGVAYMAKTSQGDMVVRLNLAWTLCLLAVVLFGVLVAIAE